MIIFLHYKAGLDVCGYLLMSLDWLIVQRDYVFDNIVSYSKNI